MTNSGILSIFLCKYFVWIPVVCEVGFIMVLHQASDKLLVNKFKLGSVSNLFMSERFFKFYSSENDIFLELITSKSSGVCCYFNKDLNNGWSSPLRGTYSGPVIVGKVSDRDFANALIIFEEFLLDFGAREIQYLLPPSYLSSESTTLTHYLLQSIGYDNFRTDLNHHIEVDAQPFVKKLSTSKRKDVNKKQVSEASTCILDQKELGRVYNLLENNRRALGTTLSLSESELFSLYSNFKDVVFLVGTYFESELVSAAFCIKTAPNTVYVFYWGHQPNCRLAHPILPLAKFIYEKCQLENIKYMDLGTSTIGDKPNWNLMFFKKSLGAKKSLKCRFKKVWK